MASANQLPPTLPAHEVPMSPSPTPTVNPQFLSHEENEKYVHDSRLPELGEEHDYSGLKKKKRRRMENRNRCVRCLCCACCLPAWATGILWFILISIVIVVVVIGSIAATFVMPTVELAGISNTSMTGSQISFSGNSININFGLIVNVNNPNTLGIQLSHLDATAYYPNEHGGSTRIGGGYLESQYLPRYSKFNFTFPFALQYNPTLDTDQSVLNDLVQKCGLTGGPAEDITVDYKIQLAAKVLFITVHPTIASSASFACPLDNGGLSGLGDGTTGFGL
ncbi:hypothetical protein EDC96DRAFT_529727 [Choanephora cucurbitarum]|nr:hypothetical protein EDC96DRAFT_529727 [Choanephora cucurbitarum]